MDPNANIREQLALAGRLLNEPGNEHTARRLAELVEALDGWLKAGGFLPNRWAR